MQETKVMKIFIAIVVASIIAAALLAPQLIPSATSNLPDAPQSRTHVVGGFGR